jgi:hypothetical protein
VQRIRFAAITAPALFHELDGEVGGIASGDPCLCPGLNGMEQLSGCDHGILTLFFPVIGSNDNKTVDGGADSRLYCSDQPFSGLWTHGFGLLRSM